MYLATTLLTLLLGTAPKPNNTPKRVAYEKTLETRLEGQKGGQEILIYKSRKKLYLYEGNRIIDSAKVSFGWGEYFGDSQKREQGDKKTPEGEYFVTEKHKSENFSYFIGVNYPNLEDAKRGLEEKLITQKQYESIAKANKNKTIPLQNTRLGGAIGIHGLGRDYYTLISGINWTRGCIALSDEDIKRIYGSIRVGSRIKIFAKSIR